METILQNNFEDRVVVLKELLIEILEKAFKVKMTKIGEEKLLDWIRKNVKFVNGKLPRPVLSKEKIQGDSISVNKCDKITLMLDGNKLLIHVKKGYKFGNVYIKWIREILDLNNPVESNTNWLNKAIKGKIINKILVFNNLDEMLAEIERLSNQKKFDFYRVSAINKMDIQCFVCNHLMFVFIRNGIRNNAFYKHE